MVYNNNKIGGNRGTNNYRKCIIMNSIHIRLSDELVTKIDRLKQKYQMKSRNEVINFIVKNFVYGEEHPDEKYIKLIEESNYSFNQLAYSLSDMQDLFQILIDNLMD